MKQKIQISIPLVLLTGMFINCWTIFLTTDLTPTWRHYIGIVLYLLTVVAIFRSLRRGTFLVGVYLLLATFNLLAFSPEIKTSWLNIGPLSTPPIQLLSLGLFIVYFVLNFNSMIEYYLDYKEARDARIHSPKN